MKTRDKCTISGGKKYEKDLSYYARGIPRPGLENRRVWKFEELKAHLLEKGDHISKIDKLPSDGELGIMDVSEAPEDMDLAKQRETISLSSFAFQGCDIMQTCWEKLTGTLSGSDLDLYEGLFVKLRTKESHPAVGLVDKRFWGVQTHSPAFEGNLQFHPKKNHFDCKKPNRVDNSSLFPLFKVRLV